ncbi:MAG: type II/IV secretion system protein [Elusimicrobia bacterium]|nr:type II/IV secretion system protein [Elusimicrobiota bacterium]
MPAMRVHWNRVKTAGGDAWAEFFAVNLDDPHFDALEGVFVVWQGGSQPAAVSVGLGSLRDALKGQRSDPAMAPYRGKPLFVSWAKVEKVARAGVTRYLLEALKPQLPLPAPTAAPIEINLPGRGDEAPPDVATPPPSQVYEDLLRPDAGSLDEDPAVAEGKRREAEIKAALEAQAASEAKAIAAAREEAESKARAKARAEAAAKADAEARAKSAAAARAEVDAAAKVRERLPLQPAFQRLIESTKEMPKTGFFGSSSAKPQTNEDKLVGIVVQLILSEAMRMRASDIHLEPQESYLRVRYRIDGIMEEVLQVPHDLKMRVVSNIRVACSLDPEKLAGGKPEDGRVTVNIGGREADLRLSTFPTAYGDKAVLRVIQRTTTTAKLDELGLLPASIRLLNDLTARPQGMIVVTGPTGSGKSTTLYALLQGLNDSTKNIVTLEDPVERKIKGISQGQIQPRQGFGFAEGLRAILRQDPNVIMVGEIRDQETAEIALSASLTGHLLLTTLHTNSALGAVGRLIDMGLEPFLVASALTAVTAQRLARTICPYCAEPCAPTAEEVSETDARARRAGIEPPKGWEAGLKKGAGCDECRGTGYSGRTLIFEAVVVKPALREAILRKGTIDELKAAAKDGLEPLLLDGLRKAAEGRTTLDEVMRVVDSSD